MIVRHEKFVPLSSPGGDGRNDIALLYIRTRGGRGISFDKFVTPACLPAPDTKIKRWVVSCNFPDDDDDCSDGPTLTVRSLAGGCRSTITPTVTRTVSELPSSR